MLKLDKVLKTKFILNGEPIYSVNPKEILQEIFLSVPDIVYWSSEAMKEFIVGTFQLLHEFGKQVKQELKETGSVVTREVSANFTKFSTWTSKTIKFLPKDREKLILFVFNTIMTCEGKGLLPGFGMSNKHQDKIPGNPERVTICPLPKEIPLRSKK